MQSLLPGTGAVGSNSSAACTSGHGKSSDVSKAAMLHRGAEYIRQLRGERQQQQEEMEQLKQNIETLNTAISGCQALLPASGAPVSRQRNNRIREMFEDWVRVRTLQNWKFWIVSYNSFFFLMFGIYYIIFRNSAFLLNFWFFQIHIKFFSGSQRISLYT